MLNERTYYGWQTHFGPRKSFDEWEQAYGTALRLGMRDGQFIFMELLATVRSETKNDQGLEERFSDRFLPMLPWPQQGEILPYLTNRKWPLPPPDMLPGSWKQFQANKTWWQKMLRR